MVSSAEAASASSAVIQPKAPISACASGANTNWPKEPPALMKPEAKARRSAGRRCAAAPMRIEKLPPPAPAAATTPRNRISPRLECMNGVSASPSASSTAPTAMILTEPARSASAPKMGWAAPHTNWPTASAKLMVTMPRPVEVLSGDTNRPSVLRMPMVTASISAAEMTSIQYWRLAFMHRFPDGLGSAASARSMPPCSAPTPAVPSMASTSHCALRHSGSAALSLRRPAAVTPMRRLRGSAPTEMLTQPCAASGARLRLSVLRSISSSAANSDTLRSPRAALARSEYWVTLIAWAARCAS